MQKLPLNIRTCYTASISPVVMSAIVMQITLYCNMLGKKHSELLGLMERLEGGLEKLKNTASQVDDLKEKLAAQEVRLMHNMYPECKCSVCCTDH